jgi:protease IV
MSYYTPPAKKGALRRVFEALWAVLDGTRRIVLNLLFLALFVGLLVAVFSGGKSLVIKDKTALVLDIKGRVVDQRSGSSRDRLMKQVQGEDDSQTQLRDVLAALDEAAKDSRIERVVLHMDDFGGAGLTSLREIAAAIERFKASGKPVIAWASNYSQGGYYLAAHANEVYMHPMGIAMLEGYGRYRNYYKDAFERVGVQANVIRVGKYKNFGEPYFANAPSAQTMESEKYLYDDLWKTYTDGVEKARKMPAGAINKSIETVVEGFTAAGGNGGKYALDTKMVDGLKTWDEMRKMLMEKGAPDDDKKSYRRVTLNGYVAQIKPQLTGDAVAIVVAQGNIVDGSAPAGTVGGLSTSAVIRKAREDDKVKAVVLRVNSPGGSAFASELIRRELELTKAAGKPVVVSMGDVAASGGYWVAMSSDEIIADAATITGSIGVFGMLPTGEKAMEKVSVSTGGYTTTWLANAYVQKSIQNIYTEFTTKAAVVRKTTPEKIDEVAQGRVWTGTQAKDRNLIDRTGSLGDAIKSAAAKAKLSENPRIMYMEKEPSRFERLLAGFMETSIGQTVVGEVTQSIAWQVQQSLDAAFTGWFGAGAAVDADGLSTAGVAAGAKGLTNHALVRDVAHDFGFMFEQMQRNHQAGLPPFAAITHCLCDVR